jgi:hypothetical protein
MTLEAECESVSSQCSRHATSERGYDSTSGQIWASLILAGTPTEDTRSHMQECARTGIDSMLQGHCQSFSTAQPCSALKSAVQSVLSSEKRDAMKLSISPPREAKFTEDDRGAAVDACCDAANLSSV